MDEKALFQNLAEELIKGWDVIPTGGGYLVLTDWQWPNQEHIEVYVRTVGQREDLFLVSDGGEIFNFLFAQGIDLSKDENAMRLFNSVAQNYGAKIVDYQMAKGASGSELQTAIRMLVEAIKDVAFILWHKIEQAPDTRSTH